MDRRIAEFVVRKSHVRREYRGQAYPSWVRSHAVSLARELGTLGVGVREASRRLDLRWETLERWLHAEDDGPSSLVPVRLTDEVRVAAPAAAQQCSEPSLSVVSPDGWRIVGLDLAGVVAVMERLR